MEEHDKKRDAPERDLILELLSKNKHVSILTDEL
jgi:hypothetical protein